MTTRVLRTFLLTSDPLPKYGGVQISPHVMPRVVEQINAGMAPWNVEHDGCRSFNPRVLLAEVRETETRSLGVWVELEVDEREWEQFAYCNGLSVAILDRLFVLDADSDKPRLFIAADAGQFDEDTLRAAVAQLQPYFAVSWSRLYQFSDVSPARVIIEFFSIHLKDLGTALVAGALIEGLKKLLKPKQAEKTTFELRIKNADRTMFVRLETGDSKIIEQALTTFNNVALQERQADRYEFDTKQRRWISSAEVPVKEEAGARRASRKARRTVKTKNTKLKA